LVFTEIIYSQTDESFEICKNDFYPCLNNLEELKLTDTEKYCIDYYNTSKCQNLFKFGLQSIDTCAHLNFPENYEQSIFDKSVVLRFYCSTDEKGNRCPIINLLVELYENDDSEIPQIEFQTKIYHTIEDTCSLSAKCSNEFIGFTKSYTELKKKFDKRVFDIPDFEYIDIELMEKASSYLQSKECQEKISQQQNSTISIKFNMNLYILLFNFFPFSINSSPIVEL